MVNSNYIRVGRLVRIARGPRADKVGVISAIIDVNRVLVENPADKKMWRHVQSVKNIVPQREAITLNANASTSTIKAALAKKDILGRYAKSGQAKAAAAKQALAASSEFERYQLRVAKRQRAHLARVAFAKRDERENISLHRRTLNHLEKAQNKYVAKKNAQRHARIKAFFAKKKAKRAGKGKNAKK